MPIRRSPNGAGHTRPQPGRDRPECVVAINRNQWSQSIGTGGRDQPVRAISGKRVARELSSLIDRRGKPDLIVSDHGTEFTSNAMLTWSNESQIAWHFIAPGKPMQNGICESFNGRMRDEFLNETLFVDLDHARSALGRWVIDFNERRPHSALGYQTPAAFAATLAAAADRLRNPDQLRRSPVAPPAHTRHSQPRTLASNG